MTNVLALLSLIILHYYYTTLLKNASFQSKKIQCCNVGHLAHKYLVHFFFQLKMLVENAFHVLWISRMKKLCIMPLEKL